jgi:membrane peptidoglycan carboxypeptidase
MRPSPFKKKKKFQIPWGYIWGTILFVFLVAGGLAALYITSAYTTWRSQKPRIDRILYKYANEVSDNYDSTQYKPIRIYDRNEKLIGEFYRKSFRPIRTDNLSNHANIIWAILSSEDREFYHHYGVNPKSIARAVFANITRLKFSQGGSTITQQLSKLTLDLGERNLQNKFTEFFCALHIENEFDKQTILAMYLNQIFLGEGNTGVEEASLSYFKKSAKDLSPEEAALIAGIIPAPSVYNPIRNLKISLERQRRVLFDMANHPELNHNSNQIPNKFSLILEKRLKAFQSQYSIREIQKTGRPQLIGDIGNYGIDRGFKINLAPEFNSEVKKEVMSRLSEEDLEFREIKIITTLDSQVQKVAEKVLSDGIDKVRSEVRSNTPKKGKKNTSGLNDEITKGMSGAFVSMNPNNGEVLSMVGGDYGINPYKWNRAELTFRQPGSVMKALLYTLAYQKGIIHPFSTVVDEKINISGYSPRNWYKGFRGPVTARSALAQSINTVAVKLLNEVGVNNYVDTIANILMLSPEEKKERFPKNLSIALGSAELSPMELAWIFATIQNGGQRIAPHKIRKVIDVNTDEVLYESSNSFDSGESILDPVACAMAVNTLEAVLTEEGTMRTKITGIPIAGKTGTVQFPKLANSKFNGIGGVRDVWFAGMSPNLTSVVWIGNDQGAPFPGTGAETAGGVWVRYILSLTSHFEPNAPLIREFFGDYVRHDICGEDGYLLTDRPACKFPLYGQYFYKGIIPEPQKQPLPTSKPQPVLEEDYPDPFSPEEEVKPIDTKPESKDTNNSSNEGI